MRRKRERLIITLDGPSGAGKSTLGRLLSRRLGFRYVDTGALYRALAWWIREKGLNPADDGHLEKACRDFPIALEWNDDGSMRVRCDFQDVSHAIRTDEIAMLASRISARKPVRDALWSLQRDLGSQGGMVFEGRDMGSRVFPEAGVRFFVTASQEERARRRFQELRASSHEVTLPEVTEKMIQRDQQDASRALAPLMVPDGAVIIDTTARAPQELVEEMLKAIEKAGLLPSWDGSCDPSRHGGGEK
jgi:cytidylate kinase